MHYKRSTCRLCTSPNVSLIYAMPACPPVDNYRFEEDPQINLPAFPMDLYMCRACGHAQLLDVVDPEILFGNYIYTSGSSPDLDAHFTAYAERLTDYARLSPESLVVDIGSNDGLLLSKFRSKGVRIQGVDASNSVSKQAIDGGIPTIVSFFTAAVAREIRAAIGKADLVCANNVFSHSDNLRGFAEAVRDLLKPDGLFVFEVSYLRDLVENRVVDYVYHEHLAHHSIKPLKIFFESLSMRLIDVERVTTKGGSIRCYAALAKSTWTTQSIVQRMILAEETVGLYRHEVYVALKQEMETIGLKTRVMLEAEVSKGGKVACYGASATSTVITSIFDVNKYFSLIVDDNPIRQGRLSPGYKIQVKSNSEFLAENPAITFIAAWRFADMIISRNKLYLATGGAFIVPLPAFKVVGRGGL